MTHTLLCVCVWVENSIIQPWKVCESSEWVNVWSCVKADEDQIRQKDWSSSSCFVLVKQMHKSICVFFSSLNTCWSLWIHVLFQALSLLLSALYCGQSAFPPCLQAHNQTKAQSPKPQHTQRYNQTYNNLCSLCIGLVKILKNVSNMFLAPQVKSTHKTELPS